MCVCMYACMHVCIMCVYVCMHVYITCVCVCMHGVAICKWNVHTVTSIIDSSAWQEKISWTAK